MRRYAANILTSVRILLSSILLVFSGFSVSFFVLYTLCGLTDLLDGPIARATGSTSLLGAKLDTIGDVICYVAMAKIMTWKQLFPIWFMGSMIVALLLFILSALIAKKRFGRLYFTHSFGGKAMGVSLFLLPFSFLWKGERLHMLVTGLISLIAGWEAVQIQKTIQSADADVLTLHMAKSRLRRG